MTKFTLKVDNSSLGNNIYLMVFFINVFQKKRINDVTAKKDFDIRIEPSYQEFIEDQLISQPANLLKIKKKVTDYLKSVRTSLSRRSL
jgi:hypothetical protein